MHNANLMNIINGTSELIKVPQNGILIEKRLRQKLLMNEIGKRAGFRILQLNIERIIDDKMLIVGDYVGIIEHGKYLDFGKRLVAHLRVQPLEIDLFPNDKRIGRVVPVQIHRAE